MSKAKPWTLNDFEIDGYYKDDGSEFYNYIVTDDETVRNREPTFFFGLSEEEIIEAIELKEDTVHDFVITAYRRI